jgi:glucosamine--fructose-6-phosphate aminotransferase (isomerizing)
MSGNEIAVVHNGIIENHASLRARLQSEGYQFQSETDTEIVVHLLHQHLKSNNNFLSAVTAISHELEGAYALCFINNAFPNQIIAVRRGSPIVVGMGIGENFVASDQLALLPVTQRFIYLEDNDIADITADKIIIYDANQRQVQRKIHTSKIQHDTISRGDYRHFMLKEIFEQPKAINDTLLGRIYKNHILEAAFGDSASQIFDSIQRVQIVACGTSYHAGLIARYWLEGLARIPCQVEIASEIRYRKPVVEPHTLFITLSQSGETADTLAALREAKSNHYAATLTICNVPESSLVRESDLALLTCAGPEIGVASTKAFTTQLTALFLLVLTLGRRHGLTPDVEEHMVNQLRTLPEKIEQALALDNTLSSLAKILVHKQHALYIGRGLLYPIALEGALKLKEISYIHAEAYPAGELKHGPLALVDKDMPVIAVAPPDNLIEKVKSNLSEIRARGGDLIVFTTPSAGLEECTGLLTITMPEVIAELAPIVYTIPLQLLAYHVAVLKGTDVDQPRNLAKSVTVE